MENTCFYYRTAKCKTHPQVSVGINEIFVGQRVLSSLGAPENLAVL